MSAAVLAAAIPPHVRNVCEVLAAAGHEAVIVGGCVRDALLGRVPGDWDVATSAPPQAVIALFPRVAPTGLAHGTVTVIVSRNPADNVEVTTYRGEGAYSDARRPDHVRFGVPLVEDLARRDLRVNAIAFDPVRGVIVDPYDGQRDLAERVLRAVGPTRDVYADAVARFSEDGLRVMRVVRFAAQLEFTLDADTARGIRPALPSLAKVSRERVCTELRKILAAREPSRALAPALDTGIIASIAPELAERALDERWLGAIDRAPVTARLGAFVAPVAEAARREPGWQREGAARAEAVLRRLKFANDEIARAAAIAGAAGALALDDVAARDVRVILAAATRAHAEGCVAYWHAARADSELATLGLAILERRDALSTGELAVTGADVIAELSLPPGPVVGKLLAALLARVLDDPACNTRERLLALAAELRAGIDNDRSRRAPADDDPR